MGDVVGAEGRKYVEVRGDVALVGAGEISRA